MKMSNNLQLPTLKVYKPDYSFIIKNYLSPEMWKETWTIFAYRDYVVNLQLNEINCVNNKIVFKMIISNNIDEYRDRHMTYIYYHVNRSSIDMLMKSISRAIYLLIETAELAVIRNTSSYKSYESIVKDEDEKLRDIADTFLDDNNVSNKDIREVYIESYVDSNKQADILLQSYLYRNRYHHLLDFYLVFADSIKDGKKIAFIKDTIDSGMVDKIIEEIEDFKKQMGTEEYKEEMKDNLEEI